MSSTTGDEKELWSDEESDSITCLFCSMKCPSQDAFLAHVQSEHGFDFLGTKNALGLDFYGCIRLVNFIRSEFKTKSQAEIQEALVPSAAFLSDDQYLQPVMVDDALLFADWDDDSEDEEPRTIDPSQRKTEETPDIKQLMEENMALKQRLAETQTAIQNMSATFKVMLDSTPAPEAKESETTLRQQVDVYTEIYQKQNQERETKNIESDYFGSYSTRDIHELMLRDKARTEAYRDFMYENKDYFEGKVVLDIGCGTGILSMFAARAGASKVIGIDMAGIIDKARIIVNDNGLSDKVTLIRSKAEEAELPVEQVDIIISEWMGYFLLYESMLPSVLYARDRWLKPGGKVFPNLATMFLAGAEMDPKRKKHDGFWEDVYGFDMKCLLETKETHRGSEAECVPINTLVTSTQTLQRFDIQTVRDDQLDFKQDFTLTATRAQTLELFVVWFDTLFDNTEHSGWSPINLSTGPYGPIPGDTSEEKKERMDTHWKQQLFWLQNTLDLQVGDQVTGTLTATRHAENQRAYDVEISYQLFPSTPSTSDNIKYLQEYLIE